MILHSIEWQHCAGNPYRVRLDFTPSSILEHFFGGEIPRRLLSRNEFKGEVSRSWRR
jgi:hypothetical protein